MVVGNGLIETYSISCFIFTEIPTNFSCFYPKGWSLSIWLILTPSCEVNILQSISVILQRQQRWIISYWKLLYLGRTWESGWNWSQMICSCVICQWPLANKYLSSKGRFVLTLIYWLERKPLVQQLLCQQLS